jgi:hypothetical protein
MSSSSSQVKKNEQEEEMYEKLSHIAMQQSLAKAKREQDQRGNTTVTESEKLLEQAVMKGDLEEVAQITKSQFEDEINLNRNQIPTLIEQMNHYTKNATTLQDIDDIRTKLNTFSDEFKSRNNNWRDNIKQLENVRIVTLNRLETIREKGIKVPEGQIKNDNFTIRETDHIITGYKRLISDNELMIKHIKNFIDKDLTNKQQSILSNELSLLELEDEPEKKSKKKKKPKSRKGGKKSKRKTKRKTKRGKTKRNKDNKKKKNKI